MRNQASILALAVTTAISLSALTLHAPAANAADASKEKCFGIDKAGKNDCAANGHACAGQAKSDGNAKEFVTVPAGTCGRIVNGQAG